MEDCPPDLQGPVYLLRCSGDKKAPALSVHCPGYLYDLLVGLSCCKDDLRHALSQMPVMVDLCKVDIFVGEMPELLYGILNGKSAGLHCIKNISDSCMVHGPRGDQNSDFSARFIRLRTAVSGSASS